MTLEEAKQKVNKNDEAVATLLKYITYLEDTYVNLKDTSEEHRKQVGELYKELDEG